MNDFERAAERLRRDGQQGVSAPRPAPIEDIAETHDGSTKAMDSLRQELKRKLNEPLDVLLPETAPSSLSTFGKNKINNELPESLSGTDSSMAVSSTSHPIVAPKASNDDPDDLPKKSSECEMVPVERKLELSFSSLAERGFVTPGLAKGRLTEEYRRIKRPLLKFMTSAEPGSRANVIMVTSSVQGEGKTYTSLNLAISLAQEKNSSVLLIDADVVKGTAGRELGIAGDQAGLLDLLATTYSHPSEVVLGTNIPSLTFMPAGKANDNANELLTSNNMRDTVDMLSRESGERVIVLDCPPILQTNEAIALAEYAGQIVFVVAEQQTSQSVVQEALRYLDKDKYVGMLLNKSSRAGAGYGYGYRHY